MFANFFFFLVCHTECLGCGGNSGALWKPCKKRCSTFLWWTGIIATMTFYIQNVNPIYYISTYQSNATLSCTMFAIYTYISLDCLRGPAALLAKRESFGDWHAWYLHPHFWLLHQGTSINLIKLPPIVHTDPTEQKSCSPSVIYTAYPPFIWLHYR